MSNTSIYGIWSSMIQRCSNPNDPAWMRYGGRGIVVCDAWRSFEGFFADVGERPKGMSLDRIDPNGNYEPSNCRWATTTQQRINQRRVADAASFVAVYRAHAALDELFGS